MKNGAAYTYDILCSVAGEPPVPSTGGMDALLGEYSAIIVE